MKMNLLRTSLLSLSAAFMAVSCGSTDNVTPPPAPEQPAVQVQETPEPSGEDLEYNRSIGDIAITKDAFTEDKNAIQQIIKELDVVMKQFDYKSWLKYIDPDSVEYWQKPVNLKKAQGKLPKKGLQLRTLEDYFKFVFVPSRAGREVPEIRYVTPEYVKAVQFQSEQDIIYYHFNKKDGKWMLHLPPIEN